MPTAVVFFHSPQSFDRAFLNYAQTQRFVGFRLLRHRNGNFRGLHYGHKTHPGILFEVNRAKRYSVDDEEDLIQEMYVVNLDYEAAFNLLKTGRSALVRRKSYQIIRWHKPKVVSITMAKGAAA